MKSDNRMAWTMSPAKKDRAQIGQNKAEASSLAFSSDEETLDIELATRAAKGDKGAFERLIWRWWDRIRGYCASFVAFDEELSEEAVQESLIRIYKALPKWRKESSLGGYIYGICRTSCADVLRVNARNHARNFSVEEFESLFIENPHGLVEEDMLRKEASQMLELVMKKLEPEDRSMLYLHEVEGIELSELGSMYNLPLGTVKSRLFRARAKLSEMLKEMGYELH
ncbi:MAG TPA: sigma-70 family RNA polymerase sigma factor [Rectinema sp.]|nr:sigma-70 family RNA polymerase sigma factor [Rectinema sp.]HPB07472.1 sigma-70 family RNA polymerase sigma factor [Rectinema sp.]HQK09391.1 sigma-70 family RNA polymerase sigma factor [Rectinema sp.]